MALSDFLKISDLSAADLATLLDLSAHAREAPHADAELLRDETVAMYFSKPSTRTRVSFTTAIGHLGGVPEMLGPSDLQLGRGETIEDTARVISAYAAAFVIRTFADDDVARFSAAASIPVINALTDDHHPCQALADLMTIRDHFGTLAGLTVAFVGMGANNVTHSLMEACALAGMNMRIGVPEGYQPAPVILEWVNEKARANGCRIEIGHDPREAVEGAQVVYTDVWLSMSDPPERREQRARDLQPFQVNDELMAQADPDAVFMHCLPAHRDEEVSQSVMDGPRSIVFRQAANRLPTAQAVLVALCDHRLVGERVRDALPA